MNMAYICCCTEPCVEYPYDLLIPLTVTFSGITQCLECFPYDLGTQHAHIRDPFVSLLNAAFIAPIVPPQPPQVWQAEDLAVSPVDVWAADDECTEPPDFPENSQANIGVIITRIADTVDGFPQYELVIVVEVGSGSYLLCFFAARFICGQAGPIVNQLADRACFEDITGDFVISAGGRQVRAIGLTGSATVSY